MPPMERPGLVRFEFYGPDCPPFQGNGILLAKLITRKIRDFRTVSGSKEDPHHKPAQTARSHRVKISSLLETQAVGSSNTTCLVLFIPRRQFPLVVLRVTLHLPVWRERRRDEESGVGRRESLTSLVSALI